MYGKAITIRQNHRQKSKFRRLFLGADQKNKIESLLPE